MQKYLRFGFAGLLSLFLVACSATVSIDLPPQRFEVPVLFDTQGKIFYPKNPIAFSPPSASPKNVVIQGLIEADRSLSAALAFYTRLQDPGSDPGCLDLSAYNSALQYYVCDIGPNDETSGVAFFNNSSSTLLTLAGDNLTRGIAQGWLWLGLEVQDALSNGATFVLKNLRATVTVSF